MERSQPEYIILSSLILVESINKLLFIIITINQILTVITITIPNFDVDPN